jgi:hypothetical protein
MRNVLSHGGIIYLDGKGRTSYGQAEMLGFVSAKTDYPVPNCQYIDARVPRRFAQIVGLGLLPTAEGQFRSFLSEWVEQISCKND